MYEQRKQTLVELENRNTELEQKFAEVTQMNLEAQKTERQLRDELSSESLSSHVTSLSSHVTSLSSHVTSLSSHVTET